MELDRINPSELFKRPFFTRIVTVKGPCKFIFIAGLTRPGDQGRSRYNDQDESLFKLQWN